MSKNREQLAVKIARKVLNEQLVRNVEYKSEIVFEDDFDDAIRREIYKLTPGTLGRIISYGEIDIGRTRTSMLEGTHPRYRIGGESHKLHERSGGGGRLRVDASSVIRAAMIDLIKENNARLTKEA